EVGSAEWFSIESKKRLRRVAMAGVEAVAFGASVSFHLVMRYAINNILPEGYAYVHKFLEAFVVLVFSLIYVAIAVDTAVIFPALQVVKDLMEGKHEPIQENLFRDTETTD
ncbi:MAG TPA: hypothetical protein VL127_16660, partial [Bryobacteraceae bacterium]|nr:hypothetical protein [Bryobacteraceae bacterium]